MSANTLAALRITRTRVGIAVFTNTKIEFARCLNLPCRSVQHAANSLRGLVNWTMEQFKNPTIAAEESKDRTKELLAELHILAKERGLPVITVASNTLLSAFSFPPLTSRPQLRKIASTIWPGLALMNKGEVLDAAALALHVQTERLLIH
jgi:hypothetical protein